MPTDIGFTGQRLDATGLMYYGARYYSPVIGRFVSADSIVPGAGNPQSLNRYGYVYNNPLKYTDPTGYTLACGAGDGDANCGTYYAGYSVLDARPEVQAYLTDTMDTRHMLDPILGWVASGLLGGLVADVVGVALPTLNPGPSQVSPYEHGNGDSQAPQAKVDSGRLLAQTGTENPGEIDDLIGSRSPADIAGNSLLQPDQPSVSRSQVLKYAEEMKNGTFDWRTMEDKILITQAKDGHFIGEGHHRFLAAKVAGVEIPEDAIEYRYRPDVEWQEYSWLDVEWDP